MVNKDEYNSLGQPIPYLRCVVFQFGPPERDVIFRWPCMYYKAALLLSIERKRPRVIEHSLQPPVGLSVQCIVAKRPIGYGCGLGWYRSDESRDEAGG